MSKFSIKKEYQKNALTALTIIGGIAITKITANFLLTNLYSLYLKLVKRPQLKKETEKARLTRDQKIASFLEKYSKEISENRINEITFLSANELLTEIKSQNITSRESCIAYCMRLATIGKDLCLIGDVDFENSIKIAEEADAKIKAAINDKKTHELPYLIGLPLTVKDVISVKGLNCNLGMQKLATNIIKEDAYLVQVLKENGAIILGLTNVPQSLFSYESSNNVWGDSQNPWNRIKTTGGSSGGDAGCVASYCSPLSIGGDIGGSIRIPAAFCGTYGFKPSYSRIAEEGLLRINGGTTVGWKPWLSSIGPLSRNMNDLTMICRFLFGKFKNDTMMIQKEFNEKDYENGLLSTFNNNNNKKAKIAFVNGFSRCEPMKEITVILNQAKKHFQDQGHEIVELDMEKHFWHLYQCGARLGGIAVKFMDFVLAGEKPKYYFNNPIYALNASPLSFFITKLYCKLTNNYRYLENLQTFRDGNSTTTSSINYVAELKKLDDYRNEFFNYCKKEQIEGIIAPVMPYPAFNLGEAEYSLSLFYYTGLQNILNLSAGTVPIKLCEDNTYESVHNDYLTRSIKGHMLTAKGMPLALQVCTLPFQDEKCLKLMEELDKMNKYSENKQIQDSMKSRLNSYLSKK